MVLALAGVGTVLYTLTLTLELVLEGQLGNLWGRRRMQRDIDGLEGHAIVCGWGRDGRAAAEQLAHAASGRRRRPGRDRLSGCPFPHVLGDATDDDVLRAAGIRTAQARSSPRSTTTPGSVYVVLTARSLNPDLFVIARSRTDDAEAKFLRAGADRVVNPQRIGGNRIAAFADSPDVVDFLDVVMHEGGHEFRLVDIEVHDGLAARRVEHRRHPGPGGRRGDPARAAQPRAVRRRTPTPEPVLEIGRRAHRGRHRRRRSTSCTGGRTHMSRRLMVLRHAKSAYPPGVLDHDRPLAPRGVGDARPRGRGSARTSGCPTTWWCPARGVPAAPGPSSPACSATSGRRATTSTRPGRSPSTPASTTPRRGTLVTVLRELPDGCAPRCSWGTTRAARSLVDRLAATADPEAARRSP